NAKTKEAAAAAPGATAADRSAAAEARDVADAVKQLSQMPKAKREYNALQLTASKRLSKSWLMMASYTYSQTKGNYAGLFSADNGQLDPNFTSWGDAPQLLINRNGPLPNDRPHIFRLDGFYEYAIGHTSSAIAGLAFIARSGQPQNALGSD